MKLLMWVGLLAPAGACAVAPAEVGQPDGAELIEAAEGTSDFETEAARRRRGAGGGTAASGGSGATSPPDPAGGSGNRPLPICGPGVTRLSVLPAGYRLVSKVSGQQTYYSYEVDPTAPSTSLPTGLVLECYTTSDGERFPRFVQNSTTTVRIVSQGSPCGYVSGNVEYQCSAGSVCLTDADGRPGICQAPVRPPVNPG
jgi:hypothetical protein